MSNHGSGKFISTFLDSPIIKNERDEFLELLLRVRSGEIVKAHKSSIKKAKLMLSIVDDDDLSALDPDLYPSFDNEMEPSDKIEEIRSSIEMTRLVVSQASSGARTWGSPAGLGVSSFTLDELDPVAISWYSKMRLFEEIVQCVSCTRANGLSGLCRVRSGNLYYVGDEFFGLLKFDHVDCWYLVSYTQLLMFKDMYYSRFNSIVAAWQIYQNKEIVDTIKSCLEWFFKCLAVYGNKGYEIGKSIEALSKANLIRRSDSILGENGSYDDQLEGLRAKERSRGKRQNFLADELDLILRRDHPMPELVELFGLQKMSGHPLIDPEVGGRSVKEEARKKINYSYSKVRRLRNNCCRLYLEGYIRRERQWPPLVFTPEAKRTKLYQLYSLGERKIDRSSYPISDWEEVRFGKHHEFDYYPNFTDLMDDKSISFYRDEAAATWNKKIKTRSHQRLLLEMLSRPEISIYEIVERVRTGDIPYSWMIVSLYPKEREFKIAARMFSMMVFEMRAYFTATEANMAEHIFPNLPQQTMTLSKQEIQELFHKVTQAANQEDMERLYLEIDLTRWNLRWHPEVIDPIGLDLDDMFGLPGLYTTIHHFFSQCMILVRVPVCKPKEIDSEHPPESDLLFYDHEVGFEGIGQKPWTFATYGMIDLGAGDIASMYYLIGQGDNQIILMSINCAGYPDKKEYLRSVAKKTKIGIQAECENVGQEAKPEECLESTCVVTYSKDVYIHGVEYFTSIKAHSRIFPHSSADFPSLDGSIGSISGQCLAAAEKTKKPMNSFVLWCFHAALYLYRLKTIIYVESCMIKSKRETFMTDRIIYGMLVLPGELGGTQIAPVTSFFYKGGSDPLSKAYSSLKFYQGSSGMVRKIIYSLKEKLWFEEDPDLDLLIDDPYGLPLKRPATAENSIMSASKAKVHGLSQNNEIKEITSAKIEEFDKALKTALKACNPFNPVLLADIRGWSVIGAQAMIAKMFTSTRTIQGMLQSDSDLQVCSQILATGTGHFMNIVARLNTTRTGESIITNIFHEVTSMREAWPLPRGSALSGVTSYVPFDLPCVISSAPVHEIGFKAMVLEETTVDPHHERGPEDPYIGRSTTEKRSEHGYRIITSSAPERAVKRLADIATQPGVSVSFKKLVAEVAKTRADVILESLLPLIGTAIGGTIAHRYASRLGLKSANGLGSLSFASLCILVNDDAYPISGGKKDIAIMIQEIMVCEIALLAMNKQSHPGLLYCLIRTSETDWNFLPEENIEVTNIPDLNPPFLSGNRLATVPDISLQRTHGPLSTPFISPLTNVGSMRYNQLYAARRLIGRAMEGSHSALAIADQGSGVIRFKIDILEARGIGLKELVRAAACEIGLTAIETILAKINSELRWTPVPLINTLSAAMAKCLIQTYLHPMFQSDEYVIKILRPSHLRYTFAGKDPVTRLKDDICKLSINLFKDPQSEIYIGNEILFSDDKSTISSRLIMRRLKAILLQGSFTGQVHTKQILRILKVLVPGSLRSEHEESGKLSALYRLCVTLASWSSENGLTFLYDQLTSLYTGARLSISRIAATELLRAARLADIGPPRSLYPHVLESGEIFKEELIGLSWSSHSSLFPFSKVNYNTSPNDSAYLDFQLTRLTERFYGKDSTAGYSYHPITKLTKSRVCVLIGSGYGSGAATILVHGAAMVFGLDLWRDTNEISTMLGLREPPAIKDTQTSSKYVQIKTNPNNTGDIFKPSTAFLINRNTSAGSLYIIDVPIKTPQNLTDILSTCTLLTGDSELLIRLIKPISAIVEIVATLRNSGLSSYIIPVFSTSGWSECWVHVVVPPIITIKGVTVDPNYNPNGFKDQFTHPVWLGGGKNELIESLEGSYFGLDNDELEDGALAINSLLDASVGELQHRFTYHQWTEFIHTLVIRRILTSIKPISSVKEHLSRDITIYTIGSHTIPITLTDRLRMILTKQVPRLIERATA